MTVEAFYEMSANMETSVESLDPLKVSPVTVQGQTVEKLRNAILTGVFKPGDRLVEAKLCRRMGVSRPSIREALRRLEAEQLVTIIPNRGPYVSNISWKEAEEIYKVRALLEGEATALFAARSTETERQELRQALEDFEAAVETDNALERLAATGRFYDVILRGCGNMIISELLKGLVARITFLRARSMSRPGRAPWSAAEMRKMYTAVEERNVSGARRAAIQHVRAASRAAKKAYAETQRDVSENGASGSDRKMK
jgi:DNA-binding GntR family transcriptional regulator